MYSNKEDMKFICKLNLQHKNYIQYIYRNVSPVRMLQQLGVVMQQKS